MGTQLRLHPKGGRAPSPNLGPCLLWPNYWMDQGGMAHDIEVGLGPGHILVNGDTAPQDRAPNFWPMSIVAKTAGWIKTPLGTEVDLGLGHFVLDGFPAIGERATAPLPSFRPMPIMATVAHLSYC